MLSDEPVHQATCHHTDYPLLPGLVDSSNAMRLPPRRYRYQKGLFCMPQYMTCVAGGAWFPPWAATWAQGYARSYYSTTSYQGPATSSHSWEWSPMSQPEHTLAIEDDNAPYQGPETSSHSWGWSPMSQPERMLAIEEANQPVLTYRLRQYAASEAGSMLSDDAVNRSMPQAVLDYLDQLSDTSHRGRRGFAPFALLR